MTPDFNKYRSFMDRFELTDEQKAELIQAVWGVVETFAYRSFGLDPVQRIASSAPQRNALVGYIVLDFEKTPNPDQSLTDTFRMKARKRRRKKT